MMTAAEYKAKVLDVIELDSNPTLPTIDQLIDSVGLPKTKRVNRFKATVSARMTEFIVDQLVNDIATNDKPQVKGKKWIPCPECGLPQCSLGHWE